MWEEDAGDGCVARREREQDLRECFMAAVQEVTLVIGVTEEDAALLNV